MSISDNFDRANGDPGANWTDTTGAGASILSNQLKGDTAADYAGTRYSGSAWANDHSSQVFIQTAGYCGPAVRMSAGTNWYCYFDHGPVQECIGGGAPAEIAVWGDTLGGETLKLVVTSTTLEGFIGAVSQGTVVDASLASGASGAMFYDNTSLIDNWVGTGESGGAAALPKSFVRSARIHRAAFW